MEQRLSVPERQIFLSDSADERHSQHELWEAQECWLACLLALSSSLLAIYGISLISQQN